MSGAAGAGPLPLRGSIALVTGASRGIGLAVSDELRAAGAHVVRLARSLTDGSGDRETTWRCDLGRADEVERVIARTLEQVGVPDVVVNNAGVFFSKPLAEVSPVEFADLIAVNLTGPFLVARALVPHLVRRGHGHLVTIGSSSDHIPYTGSAAYAASKYGVRGLHEVIAAEVAASGVRTTLVSPGSVDTDLWNAIDPDAKPGFRKRKDMLRAEDVAEAVLFAVTRPQRVDVTEIRLMPSAGS
ncbi:MAG TPA: SDR family oxidoreductase [Gemmatimonadales bacterium]|nr:SDR family oxidoreductase [Gemmatimonadales bacterium]